MKIIYSDHTKIRMKQRDITDEDIKIALKSPDKILPSFGRRRCARKAIKAILLRWCL